MTRHISIMTLINPEEEEKREPLYKPLFVGQVIYLSLSLYLSIYKFINLLKLN